MASTINETTLPTITSQAIELHPCTVAGYSGQCGTLSVFEDRAEQSGRKIDLQVAVIKARNASTTSRSALWTAD